LAKADSKYSFDKKKPGKTKAFFICLTIASFLWVVHSLNTVYNYSLKVPIEFKNVPQNKKPLVALPEQVSVDLKASGLRLSLILLKRPFQALEADFNSLKSANRNLNYVLSSSHLDFKSIFGFETQIKHISPDTLYFTEKIGLQKSVPIKVPLYLKCQQGYGHQTPVISPAFITIWGDTSLIQKIDTIYTAPFTLTQLDKSVNTHLELLRPSSDIYFGINAVNISIEVEKLVQQSIVLPLQNLRSSNNKRVVFFPSNVRVTFTSLQNTFQAKDTNLFRAMIDSEKMNRSTQKCPVFLSTLPGNVTVMGIEPKEVELIIFQKH
jgi:hypothetical protein